MLPADLGPGVVAGFTTRVGGVSRGPWEGLDLGLHVGDDPADVTRNRALVGQWAGAPVSFARQVHGTAAGVVDTVPAFDRTGDLFAAEGRDALVTARAAVPLGVLVADCVPVLLADPQAGVVATAHAGRRGLLDGVLQAAVRRMVELGARPVSVRAALGPCAGPCCYEVPQEMRSQACAVLPALHATTREGTPALDLRAGCRQALAGVGVDRVDDVGGCTVEDPELYSYRRSAVTGRFAGVVHLLAGSA